MIPKSLKSAIHTFFQTDTTRCVCPLQQDLWLEHGHRLTWEVCRRGSAWYEDVTVKQQESGPSSRSEGSEHTLVVLRHDSESVNVCDSPISGVRRGQIRSLFKWLVRKMSQPSQGKWRQLPCGLIWEFLTPNDQELHPLSEARPRDAPQLACSVQDASPKMNEF